MPNHYHLLVQTPEANISKVMRRINGIYTQRFNRRHGCDGQLFRSRYKSIVVDADSYLLQLVRYIHRNPAKAGIAPMDRCQWNSLKGYLSIAKKWDWICKSFVFRYLSKKKKRGAFNEARNVAAYLLRRLRRDSLKSIGEQLHFRKYSSASSAIERLKIKITKIAA